MEFRIADTFTDSLGRLTGDEQKIVKTTAFDLQLNPANPGMSFHKLDRARDKNFWSIRVNNDIRLIVHKTQNSLLLCYTDHHDKAYSWAERRKLETHPKTGAAQLVEIRETIKEVFIPAYVETPVVKPSRKLLFTNISDDELLSYGVPSEWLNDVHLATEDTILILADHLPKEAAEALLEIATGGKPNIATPVTIPLDPFNHPDAQRRFRVMTNVEELERALEYPWEKWTVFLHPEQRQLVENEYNGPVRVSGSAGTGKTIVALHRAVFLARKHPDARILLTTYSTILANALKAKLRRLISNEPKLAERIDVYGVNEIGLRLYRSHYEQPTIASKENILEALKTASDKIGGHKFSLQFLFTEWEQIIDAWQIDNWEQYRNVERLGRKTRLLEPQRRILWSIFNLTLISLAEQKLITFAAVFSKVIVKLKSLNNPAFDFVVVDESQDMSVYNLRFFAALNSNRSDSLFFAGDLGQRIFQLPFSWKSLGVDIRGRSKNLRVNYRTSHQIRSQADRLLGIEVSDVDGNIEERGNTISVFNGPAPIIKSYKSIEEETNAVSSWLSENIDLGILPNEIGVFVRSTNELNRAKAAIEKIGKPFIVLDNDMETSDGHITISTMHLAKGLEFRTVVVMACDDEILPLQERIETVSDDKDLEEVYNTERHLLYVACTRARDYLLVTSTIPASEFLDDMQLV